MERLGCSSPRPLTKGKTLESCELVAFLSAPPKSHEQPSVGGKRRCGRASPPAPDAPSACPVYEPERQQPQRGGDVGWVCCWSWRHENCQWSLCQLGMVFPPAAACRRSPGREEGCWILPNLICRAVVSSYPSLAVHPLQHLPYLKDICQRVFWFF